MQITVQEVPGGHVRWQNHPSQDLGLEDGLDIMLTQLGEESGDGCAGLQ